MANVCDALLGRDSSLTLTRHQFSPGNMLTELCWWQLPYLQVSLLNSRFKWRILSQTDIKALHVWQAACMCRGPDSDSSHLVCACALPWTSVGLFLVRIWWIPYFPMYHPQVIYKNCDSSAVWFTGTCKLCEGKFTLGPPLSQWSHCL